METLMEMAVMAAQVMAAASPFSSSCLDVLVLLEMKLWWWRWCGDAALRRLWWCGGGSPPGGGYGDGCDGARASPPYIGGHLLI